MTKMNALVEWARRRLDRAFKWFRPPKPTVHRRMPLADRPKPTSQPRHGIRSTDFGMRKLRRHGKGRGDLSGALPKKKKGWAEDRHGDS